VAQNFVQPPEVVQKNQALALVVAEEEGQKNPPAKYCSMP
jgi:hypothetical protein